MKTGANLKSNAQQKHSKSTTKAQQKHNKSTTKAQYNGTL
jgi:hypothetical protein